MMNNDARRWILDHYRDNKRSYNSSVNINFYSKIATIVCRAVKAEGIVPKRIIDIGSGTGISTEVVRNEFPKALIETIDPSNKANSARQQSDNISRHFYCRLANTDIVDDFDLLISSMTYHWLESDDKRALSLIAARKGFLAFSVPVRRVGKRFQDCKTRGNKLLTEVYREVMEAKDITMTPRNWRGIDLSKEEIDGFQILSRDEFEISEAIRGCDFGDVLHSRGLMLALFGPKVDSAYRSLKRRALTGNISISWPIGIIVAKRDHPISSS